MQNPWMHTVTILAANTNYDLYTLMAAVDPSAPASVVFLQLQADPAGGAAKFRIGNGSLSDTDYGVLITASSSQTFQDQTGCKSIATKGMLVRCDTPEKTLSVIALDH